MDGHSAGGCAVGLYRLKRGLPSACDLSQTAMRSGSVFAVACSVGSRSASAPKISELAGGMISSSQVARSMLAG